MVNDVKTHVIAALAAILLPCHAPPAVAEVDLTVSLEGGVGYDANRYEDPDGEGSAFYSLVPAWELAWFATDTMEINAGATYCRNEFVEGEFGATDSVLGYLALYRTGNVFDGGLSLSGGVYRDAAAPVYDQSWLSVAPNLRCTDAKARQYSLNVSFTYRSYDSRDTAAGDRQDGTRWEIRPGLAWPFSTRGSLWIEAYAEGSASNEESEEYSGYGAAVGSTCAPTPRTRARLQAQWGVRDYPNDFAETVIDREDQPTFLDGRLSYRLYPWVELFASGRWTAYDSTEDEMAYDDWVVQAGVRLAHDVLLGGDDR